MNPSENSWSVHFISLNGESGIWTRAPVSRPTPLAGAPLQPLEYFSKYVWTIIVRSKCLLCYVILWLREGFSRKRINYYICRSLFCQQEFFLFFSWISFFSACLFPVNHLQGADLPGHFIDIPEICGKWGQASVWSDAWPDVPGQLSAAL